MILLLESHFGKATTHSPKWNRGSVQYGNIYIYIIYIQIYIHTHTHTHTHIYIYIYINYNYINL